MDQRIRWTAASTLVAGKAHHSLDLRRPMRRGQEPGLRWTRRAVILSGAPLTHHGPCGCQGARARYQPTMKDTFGVADAAVAEASWRRRSSAPAVAPPLPTAPAVGLLTPLPMPAGLVPDRAVCSRGKKSVTQTRRHVMHTIEQRGFLNRTHACVGVPCGAAPPSLFPRSPSPRRGMLLTPPSCRQPPPPAAAPHPRGGPPPRRSPTDV